MTLFQFLSCCLRCIETGKLFWWCCRYYLSFILSLMSKSIIKTYWMIIATTTINNIINVNHMLLLWAFCILSLVMGETFVFYMICLWGISYYDSLIGLPYLEGNRMIEILNTSGRWWVLSLHSTWMSFLRIHSDSKTHLSFTHKLRIQVHVHIHRGIIVLKWLIHHCWWEVQSCSIGEWVHFRFHILRRSHDASGILPVKK